MLYVFTISKNPGKKYIYSMIIWNCICTIVSGGQIYSFNKDVLQVECLTL